MTERLVVIGGDAAGMTAASVAKRRAGAELDVVVLERSGWTSYSACGIPYWVGTKVAGPDALVARTPQQHRDNGIDVRLGAEAVGIDLTTRTVDVREGGRSSTVAFDSLLVATGAVPIRPDLPGIDADGIHGVQTLDDGRRLIDDLDGHDDAQVVIVGAGYIGIEMAEACLRRKLSTTLIDRSPEPLNGIDPELGRTVRETLSELGVAVAVPSAVESFGVDKHGRVESVTCADGTYPADLVILGLGVRAASDLARAAGLDIGAAGGIRTDPSMAVPGHERVWAAGDCVETWDRITGDWVYVPLGTHANKQGRVVGLNVTGADERFPGIVRTAITKVCELEVARTGLTERAARRAGFDLMTAQIDSTTRAGYFPGAAPMTVRMHAERRTGRLLGAQIVGHDGAGMRINACALALWNEMTAADLMTSDLAYAPPFTSVWDPVQVAARALVRQV
ncbi:MAG: FAD-dependent oxidoreductase [Nocardioidaceae bacterium]